MNKTVGLVMLVLGVVVLAWGVSSADSLTSQMSEFFSGAPTDKTIWLLILGAVLTAVGASSFFRGQK